MIGGYFASTNGSGFLGALLAGFAAGYLVIAIKKYLKLPKTMQGLMPILIIPLLSSALMGLLMVYVVGEPVAFVNKALADWLNSLNGTNAAILGIILGLMQAFDMGGPVNKAAYAFATSTLVPGHASPIMAAVMAAGMVPPLGIALSTVLAKRKYTAAEKKRGKPAGLWAHPLLPKALSRSLQPILFASSRPSWPVPQWPAVCRWRLEPDLLFRTAAYGCC